jgi:hypothetical protein
VSPEPAPRSNVEVVFAGWLDAIRRGDLDAMRDALAPDVVHQGVLPEWICRNRDEVVAMAGGRSGSALPAVDALELVEAGGQVVMSVRGPGIGPPIEGDPEQRSGHLSVVITLAGGVITHMQDYERREDALAAAGAEAWS